jgi:D-alanyl-D-alanine carboxypeptidase (penicillin-binding protein 5/6)
VRPLLATLLAVLLLPGAARAAEEPTITSPAAIVVEATSGDVAYEKDPDARLPIASTTKLMTALLTLEQDESLDDIVTAPRYRAAPAESLMRPPLVAGEQMTERDVLRGLLMISANDAAVALAVHVGGSIPSFVRLMNRRAQELGLQNTSYANPIGLDDPNNYSSARDLATLTRALRAYPFFRHTVDTTTLSLKSGNPRPALLNRNILLFRFPWINGVKTGNTSLAGDVLVASGKREGVPLIAVVIGATDKETAADEAVDLLTYGFTEYDMQRAVKAGERKGEVPIKHRPGAKLPVVAGRTIRKVLRTDQRFQTELDLPKEVEGPVDTGDQIGTLKVLLDGEVLDTVPLNAALDVPKAGAARETQDFLTRPSTLAILGGVLLVAALALSRRPARKETPA